MNPVQPEMDFTAHPVPGWSKLDVWQQCALGSCYLRILTNFLDVCRKHGAVVADQYIDRVEQLVGDPAVLRGPPPPRTPRRRHRKRKPAVTTDPALDPVPVTETADSQWIWFWIWFWRSENEVWFLSLFY